MHLCHPDLLLCFYTIARGNHVRVYHHLLLGSASDHDLGLLIGQPSAILSIEGDDVGQGATIREKLENTDTWRGKQQQQQQLHLQEMILLTYLLAFKLGGQSPVEGASQATGVERPGVQQCITTLLVDSRNYTLQVGLTDHRQDGRRQIQAELSHGGPDQCYHGDGSRATVCVCVCNTHRNSDQASLLLTVAAHTRTEAARTAVRMVS